MAVVTTGFFDGVHLGHRHVLETVVSCARERGEEAVVVTFWPHPRAVLQQDARDLRLLTTLEEKKALISAVGIDRVEVLPFTREFASLTAAQYLDLLAARFDASLVVMGYDNKIGSDLVSAEDMCHSQTVCFADPSHLRWAPPSYAAEGGHRFDNDTCLQPQIIVVDPFVISTDSSSVISTGAEGVVEKSLSSTKIRQALLEGDVELANAMLGYRYAMTGAVVAGNRLGRTIGFPTANMQLYEPLKLVPGNGVYAVSVEVLGESFKGMCNIGMRPTVGGAYRTIETHILDFDRDIYGLPLTIRFCRRIRDERHFPSLDALRGQLVADRELCR
ncbi:MAG: bifunctional riboflavin kinase/FMN adenylyltransferase [Bacteroidales bacterium]|nr:bifunctional riboflavin kinase/FMN adenylyltransferase [Bacteroidales bacterium]